MRRGAEHRSAEFSGEPQCFLTHAQLVAELGAAGFIPDAAVPLTEHNLPRPGVIPTGSVPVIFEAAFRFDRREPGSL